MRIFLFILIVLGSCISASKHLEKAREHELKALAKGAKINRDTLNAWLPISITSKADSSSTSIDTKLDTGTFVFVMEMADSVHLAVQELRKRLQTGNSLNAEKDMKILTLLHQKEALLNQRKMAGFAKDSIYVIEIDGGVTISAEISGGLLRTLKYHKNETVLEDKNLLPIAVDNNIIAGYSVWYLLAALGAGIVIGLIIGKLIF